MSARDGRPYAGALQFARFNDLARGGTIARSIALRNIPGPSVPQRETPPRLMAATG